MTASKSMPLAAGSVEGDAGSKILEKSELIDRLATEMRVKSGGELPLSFCIAQVKRQLTGKQSEPSSGDDKTVPPPAPHIASVFHSWAMRD